MGGTWAGHGGTWAGHGRDMAGQGRDMAGHGRDMAGHGRDMAFALQRSEKGSSLTWATASLLKLVVFETSKALQLTTEVQTFGVCCTMQPPPPPRAHLVKFGYVLALKSCTETRSHVAWKGCSTLRPLHLGA